MKLTDLPDSHGHFGPYGGIFVAETLMAALEELRAEYDKARNDPAFVAEFPEVLFYVQRREYFRVDAPVLNPYVCKGQLADGSAFRFEVHDLSLGGVGIRTSD